MKKSTLILIAFLFFFTRYLFCSDNNGIITTFYPETRIIEIKLPRVDSRSLRPKAIYFDGVKADKRIGHVSREDYFYYWYDTTIINGFVNIVIDYLGITTETNLLITPPPTYSSISTNGQRTITDILGNKEGILLGEDQNIRAQLNEDKNIPLIPSLSSQTISSTERIRINAYLGNTLPKLYEVTRNKKYIIFTRDKELLCYNIDTKITERIFSISSTITAIALSYEGDLVAIGAENEFYILDIEKRRIVNHIALNGKMDHDTFEYLSFNSDNTKIVAGYRSEGIDGDAHYNSVWDLVTGSKLTHFTLHSRYGFLFGFNSLADTVIYHWFRNSLSSLYGNLKVERFDLLNTKYLPELELSVRESSAPTIGIQPFTGNIITAADNYMIIHDKNTGKRLYTYGKTQMPIIHWEHRKGRYSSYSDEFVYFDKKEICSNELNELNYNDGLEIQNTNIDNSGRFLLSVSRKNNTYEKIIDLWDIRSRAKIASQSFNLGNDIKIFFDDSIAYILELIGTKDIPRTHGVAKRISQINIFKFTDSLEYIDTAYLPVSQREGFSLTINTEEDILNITIPGSYPIQENTVSQDRKEYTTFKINYKDDLITQAMQWDARFEDHFDYRPIINKVFYLNNNRIYFNRTEWRGGMFSGQRYTFERNQDSSCSYVDLVLLGETLSYSIDGGILISESLNNPTEYIIYDNNKKSVIGTIAKSKQIKISGNGQYIVQYLPYLERSKQDIFQFRIFNLDKLEQPFNINLNVGEITNFNISNKNLIAGSKNGTISIVDLNTGKQEMTFLTQENGHYFNWNNNSLKFSTDYEDVISISDTKYEYDVSIKDPLFGKMGYVHDGPLRVRWEPNLNAQKLGSMQTGDKFYIYERSQEKMIINEYDDYWYMVESISGQRGWCYGAFITLLE